MRQSTCATWSATSAKRTTSQLVDSTVRIPTLVAHCAEDGQPAILYIDLQLVHEVTSPQAFEGLRLTNRSVRRPERTVATPDHNIPTTDRSLPIADPISKKQVDTLRQNCQEFGIRLYDLNDRKQGVVHIIGPELGLTQPGMTIVCGDSHTATHGAFGALAFGIGTSEVEHVLATQCLLQTKPKTYAVNVEGELKPGVSAKGFFFSRPATRTGYQQQTNLPFGNNFGKISRYLLQKISGLQFPEDGTDVYDHLYLEPQQALYGGPYAYYLRHKSKKLVVKIPPGIRDGQQIRLAAMGQDGKGGGKPGNLLLKVHIRKPLLKSIKNFFTFNIIFLY